MGVLTKTKQTTQAYSKEFETLCPPVSVDGSSSPLIAMSDHRLVFSISLQYFAFYFV